MAGNDDKRDDMNEQTGWPLLPAMRELLDWGGLAGHAILHPFETCKTFAPTFHQLSWGLVGKTIDPREKYSPDLSGKVVFVTGGVYYILVTVLTMEILTGRSGKCDWLEISYANWVFFCFQEMEV